MTTINLNNLDKSNWKTFRFDEIAKNVSERVDPTTTDLKVYIGLEHLDAETIHIQRTGTPSDVKGQKLKGYPGDVIFGKRRAYQRKAAILNEESVCSAHAFILRANPEVIEPELFPFFLHSDLFMHRMVDISVGGLSPTINWGILKSQEFLLPPKEQQGELAELLWSMDEVIEKEKAVLNKLEVLKYKQCEYSFLKGNGSSNLTPFSTYKVPKHWRRKKVSEVASVEYGISKSVANNTDPNIGWPIITSANINLDGTFNFDKKRYIEVPTKERFLLEKGDLMFNWRSGSPEHIGKTAMYNFDEKHTYASFILRIRCGETLINRYAFFLFNFLRKIEFFSKNIAQQVNFKINAAVFREIEIPVPTIEEQEEILKKINNVHELVYETMDKIDSSKALQKSLTNQVF